MKKTIQTKILSSLLLSISGILFLFIEAYAQTQTDTIVISTYYPSPYGSYNKLTTKSDTFLATDNGSVGIGTTATTSTLVVGNSIPGIGLGGNTWISMGLSGAKNASGIIMGSDSVASRYLSLAWDDGNSRGQINTANSNQPLFLQNLGSGTVIIGSNTAAAKLQVFYDNNDWTLPVLRLNNSAGNQNLMDFAFNNTPHSRIRIANGGDLFIEALSSAFNVMTNGSVRFKIDTSGNVGVGTANPGFKLSVHQTTAWNGGLGFTSTMDANRWDVGSQGGGLFGIYPNQNGNLGIALIAGTGNVGIGVNGPTAKLDINGTLRVRSGGGSNITGTLGDIAEYMLVKNDKEFELGDVVIININKPLHLELSNKPYDTLVGGVVSGENQAAFIIGEKQENQIPVALAGKVVCKVVNENGPIAIGDLLTTSSKPGYAMKATEPKPGSILGKALEHLNDTEGKIHILVNVN